MGQGKEWWLNVRRFSQTNARKQPVRASIEVCGAELLSIPFGTMVYFCFVVSCSILASHHSCVFQRGQFIKVHKIPRLSWVGITLLKYVLYPKWICSGLCMCKKKEARLVVSNSLSIVHCAFIFVWSLLPLN